MRKLAARLVAMDCLNGQAAEASVVIGMLHRELVLSVEQLGISFDGSGLACNHRRKTGHSPAEESVDALNETLGVGTRASPFQMPARGTIPLSEYKARGYMTLCFPTLFPCGRGHFEDERRTSNLGFDRWAQHLEKYYDGRFSSHARWPYFVQNTRERAIANDNAQTFLNTTTTRLTVGDVRRLSVAGKQEVFGRVSKFASTLRNTPAFFGERRKELLYMCEQLGDPHVFATNSFADTYCPHCARFIIAHLEHTRRKVHDANSPFADGLTANEAHSRRYRLMKENPHLAATFSTSKHNCTSSIFATAFSVPTRTGCGMSGNPEVQPTHITSCGFAMRRRSIFLMSGFPRHSKGCLTRLSRQSSSAA